MLNIPKQRAKPNENYSHVFGWGDRGETQNPHVEWDYSLLQLRASALINRISDQQDPATPIDEPSYPRDNSAIPF